MTDAIVMRAGECRWPEKDWDPRIQVKVSSADSNGAYSICEVVTPPRLGPPVHFHRFEDEWFYVLEGEFRFLVDGREIAAPAGTSVYAPRRVAHTFQNVGTGMGRLLTIATPGGLDHFFRDLCVVTPLGEAPEPSAYLKLYERHNLVYVAPPLSAGGPVVQATSAETEVLVVEAGESLLGRRLDVVGDAMDFKLTGKDSAGKLAAFETHTLPGGGPPPHVHSREEEFFYVVEGEVEFWVEGKLVVTGPGDCLHVPRESRHTFRNRGTSASRMVIAAFPAGLDEFFLELAEAVQPGMTPTAELVVPPFERYGLRLA